MGGSPPIMMPPPPPIPVGGSGAPPVPIPPPVPVLTPPPVPALAPPPVHVAPVSLPTTAFDDVPPEAPVVAAPSLAPPPPPQGAKMAPPPAPHKAERVSSVPSVPPLFGDELGMREWGEDATTKTVGPEILLEPLHVLDPLCVKWNIGAGAKAAEAAGAEEEEASGQAFAKNSHPVFLSSPKAAHLPSPSKQAEGYLRLMGILPTGESWERGLSMSEIDRQGGVVIGRDMNCCNVVLPEGSISRRHARIERVNRNVVVTDLDSTNGTAVNGQQISSVDHRVPMMDGSILTLGDVTLRVEIIEGAPSPALA